MKNNRKINWLYKRKYTLKKRPLTQR